MKDQVLRFVADAIAIYELPFNIKVWAGDKGVVRAFGGHDDPFAFTPILTVEHKRLDEMGIIVGVACRDGQPVAAYNILLNKTGRCGRTYLPIVQHFYWQTFYNFANCAVGFGGLFHTLITTALHYFECVSDFKFCDQLDNGVWSVRLPYSGHRTVYTCTASGIVLLAPERWRSLVSELKATIFFNEI